MSRVPPAPKLSPVLRHVFQAVLIGSKILLVGSQVFLG